MSIVVIVDFQQQPGSNIIVDVKHVLFEFFCKKPTCWEILIQFNPFMHNVEK